MIKILLLSTAIFVFTFSNAFSLNCSDVNSKKTGSKLTGGGMYFGEKIKFNNDFLKNPNRYEKKFVGMKSSKGGHSYQLVTYNPDGTMLKFWIVGLKKAGTIEGEDKARKVPHITMQFGKRSKALKQKFFDKSNNFVKVKVTKYSLAQGQKEGTADIVGCLNADWGEKGNIKVNFNVKIKDIGLQN